MKRLKTDPFSGECIEAWIGKSNFPELYVNSQSGGIVSTLLHNALDSGIIDGAITTVMEEGNPPRVLPIIVKNYNDIKKSQKSKYLPVPILSALKKSLNKNDKIALVGLPCHLHGIENIFAFFPHFKKKVKYKIGLICDRTMTTAAMSYLLNLVNLKYAKSTIIHFRDKKVSGYPGDVNIIDRTTGNNIVLSENIRKNIKDYFTPVRCRLCFDKMNVFADIVIGDPHGIDNADRLNGESIIIVRTESGLQLFHLAIEKKAIIARNINYEDILIGQKIDKKRLEWRGYVDAWERLYNFTLNYIDEVKKYAKIANKNESYYNDILHSLSLDQYQSREKLLIDAEKNFSKHPAFKMHYDKKSFFTKIINKLTSFYNHL